MDLTWVCNIVELVFGGFIGAVAALWLDRLKAPKLRIDCDGDTDIITTYPPDSTHSNETWKFTRLSVKNTPLNKLLNYLTIRETAQNCSAIITFYKKGHTKILFSMKGRWASTPEIPLVGDQKIVKIINPDPVTIPVNVPLEYLDVVTQKSDEPFAYAWNAESYLHNWKHPDRKLESGEYSIIVSIQTQNGVTFTDRFLLNIGETIQQTYITHPSKEE